MRGVGFGGPDDTSVKREFTGGADESLTGKEEVGKSKCKIVPGPRETKVVLGGTGVPKRTTEVTSGVV